MDIQTYATRQAAVAVAKEIRHYGWPQAVSVRLLLPVASFSEQQEYQWVVRALRGAAGDELYMRQDGHIR